MSIGQLVLLGLVAACATVLGVIWGGVRPPARGFNQVLNAIGVGILVFLLYDVLDEAFYPLNTAMVKYRDDLDPFEPVRTIGGWFFGGLLLSFIVLAAYDQWRSRGERPDGEHWPTEVTPTDPPETTRLVPDPGPRRIAMLTAGGLGLYNLGTTLALGASGVSGAVDLTTLLVIGLVLRNVIEGVGIVAPLVVTGQRAGWARLLGMGLIGGIPAVLGTVLGAFYGEEDLGVGFLAVGGGAIFYVLIRLLALGARRPRGVGFHVGVILTVAIGFLAHLFVTLGGIGA